MGRRSREVNIFHFSFLDILFNTIGAITFMFMIFTVMTNDLVEEKNTAQLELNQKLEKIKETEANLEKLHELETDSFKKLKETEKQIEEKEAKLKKAKSAIKKHKDELKKKDKTISQLKKMVDSMDKGTGIDSEIDPAMMAEWGEAGGSEATKISGQIVGANVETVIVSAKGESFYISEGNISTDEKLKRWIRYFDDQNQQIQFLGTPGQSDSIASEFSNLLLDYAEIKGQGIKSERDLDYPSSFSEKGVYEMDHDVDGTYDHIWHDLDLDGRADKLQVDLNNDKIIDEVYFHFEAKSRRWKTKLVDSNADATYDTAYIDTDTENDHYEVKLVDFNPKTGKGRIKYLDKDGDKIYDMKYMDNDTADDDWEEVYSKFDPSAKRWTYANLDTNNDGAADVKLKDNDFSNDNFEEKEVDEDYDGIYDSRWLDLEPNDSDWEAEYKYQDEKTKFWKEVFFDTSGNGKWDVHGINSNLENEDFEVLLKDEDGDGKYEVRLEDNDSDGSFEIRKEDKDINGEFEITLTLNPDTDEYEPKK